MSKISEVRDIRTATAYRGQDDVRIHRGDETLDLSDGVPGWRVVLTDFFR